LVKLNPLKRMLIMELGVKTMEWRGGRLFILDQRLLPTEIRYLDCVSYKQVYDAIRSLAVRGAPAIGVAAGYGMALAAWEAIDKKAENFSKFLSQAGDYLVSSRPTAVNLSWAVQRINRLADQHKRLAPQKMSALILAEAEKIEQEDVAQCKKIGEWGESLLPSPCTVLTHCNAGSLATAGYGTALGVIYAAVLRGKRVQVFCDESRPLLQGSRLTAWELMQSGIPTTIICDDMAAQVMRDKGVDLVVVGADRIAGNGDFANKIGTYGLAALAHFHSIPFYVAAPTSTIDFSIDSGRGIPIEERDPAEVTEGMGKRTAPYGAQVYNPAFDITPAELVTSFITERGIHRPPFKTSLKDGLSG
jgi:methylthioribose-1-phosphate isomerase